MRNVENTVKNVKPQTFFNLTERKNLLRNRLLTGVSMLSPIIVTYSIRSTTINHPRFYNISGVLALTILFAASISSTLITFLTATFATLCYYFFYIRNALHSTSFDNFMFITNSGIIFYGIAFASFYIKRKFAEESNQLKKMKAQFEKVQRFSNIIISFSCLNGKVQTVTPPLCRLLGYTENELLSLTIQDIMHPDDYEKDLFKRQQLINKEINNFELEKRYIRKDGRIIWVYTSCTLATTHQDKPIYFVTYIKDITAEKMLEHKLKKSNEKYEKLVELLPAGVFTTYQGSFKFANKAALLLFGATSFEDLKNKTLLEFLDPEQQENAENKLQNFYDRNIPTNLSERTLVRLDGRKISVECTSVPLTQAGEHMSLWLAYNITPLKENQRELKRVNEQLIAYIRDIDDLIYELRKSKHNYLNILQGFIGYIDNEDIEGLKKYFYEVLSESRKLQNTNVVSLQNIKVYAIRGLLVSKIEHAKKQKITVIVVIDKEISFTHSNMSIVNLCEIIGIFLDNAIEASRETDQKYIHIFIDEDTQKSEIIFENTFKAIPHMPDMCRTSYSTKGCERGNGLSFVRNMLSKYPNVHHDTYIENDIFVQKVVINNIHS